VSERERERGRGGGGLHHGKLAQIQTMRPSDMRALISRDDPLGLLPWRLSGETRPGKDLRLVRCE